MLGGTLPFDDRSALGVMMKHVHEPPISLRERFPELQVPESLDALVLRLLAKKPSERFLSLREVEQALETEIERMLVERGDKRVLSSQLVSELTKASRPGLALVLGRRRIPLWTAAPVGLLLLIVSGLIGYRYFGVREAKKRGLRPGELRELRDSAVSILRQDLHAGKALQQRSAIAALGQTHDAGLRDTLEALLDQSDPDVQVQTAQALGELGDRQAAVALGTLLDRTTVPKVRIAASRALRLLGDPRGDAALSRLLSPEETPIAATRAAAALVLCEPGPRAPAVQDALRAHLAAPELPPLERLAMQACLVRSGDTAARSALQAELESPAPLPERMAAAAQLAQLGDATGREFLRVLATRPGPEQLTAASLLASPDEPSLHALLQQVVQSDEQDHTARRLAVEGLGDSGEILDARLLGELLSPKADPELRHSAAVAVIKLAMQDPTSLPSVSRAWARGALTDPSPLVRQSAATVLGDTPGPDAAQLLGQFGRDADAMVRRSAARALGRRSEPVAVSALLRGVGDDDPGVREEALRALGKPPRAIGPRGDQRLRQDVIAQLQRVATSGPTTEQVLASAALLRLGDASQAARLPDWSGNGDPRVRQLVAEQLDPELPGQRDTLAQLLLDASLDVRFTAARRLAEAKDARALPVLDELARGGGPDAIAAYGLLTRLGQRPSTPGELDGALDHADAQKRIAAVTAVAKLPLDLALPRLLKAARDADPAVRRQVAEAAAELPVPPGATEPAGAKVLRVLLTDPSPAVRARTHALLARLTAPAEAEPSPPPALPDAAPPASLHK